MAKKPIDDEQARFLRRSGQVNIIAHGKKANLFDDYYARVLSGSWKHIFITIIVIFFSINLVFGALYYALEAEITNARPHNFSDAFFFSVQTLATIGYGAMAPKGLLTNLLVTIESMLGFIYYGIVTGIMFAKFSKPNARIIFSKVAIINEFNGGKYLMLRLANERANSIVDASAKAVLLRDEHNRNNRLRRIHDLKLMRATMPFLRLSWLLLHKIDEHSPLHGMDIEDMRNCNAEVAISITGLDETFSQTVHARFSYIADEILFDHSFVDMIKRNENSELEVFYDKIDEVTKN